VDLQYRAWRVVLAPLEYALWALCILAVWWLMRSRGHARREVDRLRSDSGGPDDPSAPDA